jgi:chromosome segregation protein
MKLSRLEILGFKSFPQKTLFEFDSGIVAIVGPNGCGKTNILDAIEWVLGEQNPFKLRGERMEDFIFKGSQTHKPLNFAEVTAVIENDDTLPISYQEVAVTRRFYRSGESEYFINRNNVRLKDITNLFLNTGLKAEAYSIFRREMIETILSTNSKTRRTLFEEAAEIAKYKNSKKITLDKLELTNTDLVRVHDIYEEVHKHWRSLKRQARRVGKYQELRHEIEQKRISIARLDFASLSEELSKTTQELTTLSQTRDKVLTRLESLETELSEKQEESNRIEDTVSQLRSNEIDLHERKGNVSERIIVLEERKKYLLSQQEYLENENRSLEEQVPHIKAEVTEIRTTQQEVTRRVAEAEQRTRELRRNVSSLEADVVAKKERYENTLDNMKQIESAIKDYQERQISQTAHTKNREELRSSLVSDLEELKEENVGVQQDIEKLNLSISEQQKTEQEIKKKLATERDRCSDLDNRMKEMEKQAVQLEEKRAFLKNEIALLAQFKKSKAAHSELSKSLSKTFSLPVLSEVVDIPDDKKDALLGVLENLLQIVLLSDRALLKDVIEAIEHKKTRAGILLSFLDIKPSPTPRDKTVIGSLAEFIMIDDDSPYANTINALCSRYLLVEGVPDALTLQSRYPEYSFVTMAGEVLSGGMLFVGKGSHRELLNMNEQIEEKGLQEAELRQKIKELGAKQQEIERKRQTVAERLEALNTEFSQIVIALKENEIAYEKRLFEKRSNEKRIEKIKHEIQELDKDCAELKNTMVSNERQFRDKHEQYKSMSNEMEDLERSYRDAEQQLQSTRKEENDILIELTQLKGELRAKEESIKLREKELETINEKIRANADRIQTLSEQMAGMQEDRTSLEVKRTELAEQHETIRASLQKSAEKKNSLQHEVDILKTQRAEVMKEEKETFEQVSALNLEKVRVETRRGNLAEKINEEFKVKLLSAEGTVPLASRERLHEELEILEERMRTFGAVNLMAEEDLEHVEKRKEDLIMQKTDLQEAQKDLLKTIDHIDSIAKEKFLETFNGVRDNFRVLFTKLFESGECDLILDGEDPLESDIVIKAQPKHKKVTRLESLSTGERTLIAIALLFSFYLVKPSPICVLDEIDAPLDDANIKRFIALLREFKKRSQLIVITHNKITMESADYLYGITMTEPNVSTVASVKLS